MWRRGGSTFFQDQIITVWTYLRGLQRGTLEIIHIIHSAVLKTKNIKCGTEIKV